MTDKFVMHGVDLTDMGIGDELPDEQSVTLELGRIDPARVDMVVAVICDLLSRLLSVGDPEDEDDGEWEYAE